MKKLILFFTIFLAVNLNATQFTIKTANKNYNTQKHILENYLSKIDLQIEDTSKIEFFLGTKKEIKSIDKKFYKILNSYENDGFLIKEKANTIYLLGVNNRSLTYAVYNFLERYLKCKFLSKTFEVIPQEAKLRKDEINYESQAYFSYREIFIKELEDRDFAMKLALNGSFGHKAKRKSQNFINNYNNFTPYELIPLRYKEIYPEFFCSGQLDFALSDVKKYATSNFKKRTKNIKAKKEDIFYIQHEDRESFCNSINSKKINAKYDSNAAAFLDYVNYIAKNNPTKNIYMEAYQWSRKAPSNFPKLSSNLGIFFSDIEANFSIPLNKGENKEIYEDFLSWKPYNKDMYVWHYITNFNGYMQPFPNVKTTAQSIKLFAKNSLTKGVFLQGAYETTNSNLSNLRAWVFSKLLWNPKLDENRLIKEFSYYYYGNAYNDVLAYFSLLENSIKNTNSKLRVKTPVNSKYLNKKFIKEAKTILNNALLKVPKDSVYYSHLIELYSGIDYVQLLKGTISEKDKKRFKNFIEENNITYHAESSKINSLNPYFNIKRVKPKAPKKVQSSNSIWLDFQEYELKLCCSTIIEDKKASSSSAVMMNGNRPDWGIQLDLNNIPNGTWKIYGNVRIEKPKELSAIEYIKPAMYYGVHEKGIKNLSIINSLKDEEYHEVYVGEISLNDDNKTGQIWFRPPNSKNVKYIFLDRIFLIKE